MDRVFHLKLALPMGGFDPVAIDQHLRGITGGLLVSWVDSHEARKKPSLLSVCGKVVRWEIGWDYLELHFKPCGPLGRQLIGADDQGLKFTLHAEMIKQRIQPDRELVVGITAVTVRVK